jgi:hypothetical protein
MAFLFGGARQQSNNPLKAYVRDIQRHVRQMDRELSTSSMQEKTVMREIRTLAEKQDIPMVKCKARELIRTRAHRQRLVITQQGLKSLAYELNMMSSTQKNQEIISQTTKILTSLNTNMDVKATYKMLMDFERQHTLVTEKQEIMSETLDGVFEADNEDVATDEAMSSVFEEMGLDLSKTFRDKGIAPLPMSNAQEEDDLEARLMRLQQQKR